MKWWVAYMLVGLFLTLNWNAQVQTACGRPMSFGALSLGPVLLPLFAPFMIWNNDKPACEKMSLATNP